MLGVEREKEWFLILSAFVLTRVILLYCTSLHKKQRTKYNIHASYVLGDCRMPPFSPHPKAQSIQQRKKVNYVVSLHLTYKTLGLFHHLSFLPSPRLSLLIKLELTFLRYHYYRTWTSKIISYLGESRGRGDTGTKPGQILKHPPSLYFVSKKALKLSVSCPLACSIKQCQLWAITLPSKVPEVHLLVHEVAWRCGETKDSLGLTVISSKERIHVVSPILPQVSP